MNASTAKKVFGSIVAAVTLVMMTSVAPAAAAQSSGDRGVTQTIQKKDTGWD